MCDHLIRRASTVLLAGLVVLSGGLVAAAAEPVQDIDVRYELEVLDTTDEPLQDACLRVVGGDPGPGETIASQVVAGTAEVGGAGSDCTRAPHPFRPQDGACLRVAGSGADRTEAIARQVMAGEALVVGPGIFCGPDPVPFIATPRDFLTDIYEIPWERLEVDPDGRTLHVYFGAGPFECSGLDRVEVSASDAGLDVRVFTGTPADAGFCFDVLMPWVTSVVLDEPVVLGGGDQAESLSLVRHVVANVANDSAGRPVIAAGARRGVGD